MFFLKKVIISSRFLTRRVTFLVYDATIVRPDVPPSPDFVDHRHREQQKLERASKIRRQQQLQPAKALPREERERRERREREERERGEREEREPSSPAQRRTIKYKIRESKAATRAEQRERALL